MNIISKEIIDDLFVYDSESGDLFWKPNKSGNSKTLKRASYKNSKSGKKIVTINKKIYRIDSLILIMHGIEINSKTKIFYLDGDKNNTKIENLSIDKKVILKINNNENEEWKDWVIEKKISSGQYDRALVKNHPNANKFGYVLYHRVIIENYIKRLLLPHEIVHHKNENKKDNRIENLEILTKIEHINLHRKEKEFIELVCAYCGFSFVKEKRNWKSQTKNGQINFYCCRKCQFNSLKKKK